MLEEENDVLKRQLTYDDLKQNEQLFKLFKKN